MRIRPPSPNAAGFTLIELLVVLALTGLLVVGLYQAFRIGSRAADRANPDTDAAAQFALMQDFMDRELAAAAPMPVPASTGQAIQFDGESASVSFVGLPPTFLALGGYQLLHLQLVGRRIEVSSEPLARGPLGPEQSTLRPSILMEGVRSITFAYFGVPAPGVAPNWNESWADRPDLPKLVRLRIILADGTHSPEIVVAPRLAQNPIQ